MSKRSNYLQLVMLALLLLLVTERAVAKDPPPGLFLPLIQVAAAPPISALRRMAILDAIRDYARATASVDMQVDAAALLPFIQAFPEITAAGESADALWGRFSDGRELVIPLLPPHEPPPQALPPLPFAGDEGNAARGAAPPAQAASRPAVRAAAGLAPAQTNDDVQSIPANKQAVILEATPACFGKDFAPIAGWLQARGYDVSRGRAEVETLRHLGELGLFHIDTHGGTSLAPDGRDRYTLGTATPVSAANDTVHQVDIANNRLIYMLARFDSPLANGTVGCNLEWNYAINEEFVGEYLSFSTHSFVWLDACAGASAGAAVLRSAFYAKGASVIAAWTEPVLVSSAFRADRIVYSLLSGAIDVPTTPPIRPFALPAVYDFLHNAGADASSYCQVHVPAGGQCPAGKMVDARLQFLHPTSQDHYFGLLSPTIQELNVYKGKASRGQAPMTLEINGLFGDVAGKVFVDGDELDVLSWTPQQILADIPANAAGPATVQVQGHGSNPPPLTSWRGTVGWTEDYMGYYGMPMKAEVTCDLHLRGDVHDYRSGITETGITPEIEVPFETQNSHCTWQMSGQGSDETGHTYRLSGSGTLDWQSLDADPTADHWLHLNAGILPRERRLDMQLGGTGKGTFSAYTPEGELEYTISQRLGPTPVISMTFDQDWNIVAGTQHLSWGDGVEYILSWPQIEAEHAPGPTTPAQ